MQRWTISYIFVVTLFTGVTQAGVLENTEQHNQPATLLPSKLSESRAVAVINGKKALANSVLVRFKDAESLTTETEQLLSSQGVAVRQQFSTVDGLARLTFEVPESNLSSDELVAQRGVSLALRIKQLKKTGKFEYVEPDWLVQVLGEPTDSAYQSGILWGLNNNKRGSEDHDINVIDAWSRTTGSPDVIIGVVDTGIRYDHQDLAANMWINPNEVPNNGIDDDNNGYIDDIHGINAVTGSGDPLDDNNHGTHSAGTIAAVGNDGRRMVGVAYTSKLMALKFLDESGVGTISSAIEVIQYALDSGVDILNNSWGGADYSRAMLDVIKAANNAGVLFVAAAGNAGTDTDTIPYYPQSYDVDNIISVAGYNRFGSLNFSSNYGQMSVDVRAPGTDIYSTVAESKVAYGSYNGTSAAAPFVSGVAALLLSEYPNESVAEIKNRILGGANVDNVHGNYSTPTGGNVDAAASMAFEEDGTLEVRISYDVAARTDPKIIEVHVSDLYPVTDAIVKINPSGGIDFLDNGASPDKVAGDGVYTAYISPPSSTFFKWSNPSYGLSFDVTAPGKEDKTQSLTIPMVDGPSNDHYIEAIPLFSGTTSASGTNYFASRTTDEPGNSLSAGRTVWWEWVAPENIGEVTFNTVGSDFDTTLAVYTGTGLPTFVLIAENDDSNGISSSVTFTATAGESYLIQVGGYENDMGRIVLNYPEPDNVAEKPVIVNQPNAKNLIEGQPLILSVEAVGAPELEYEWWREDEILPGSMGRIAGATESRLIIDETTRNDEGFYLVEIRNEFGGVSSERVFVSINDKGTRPENDDFINAKNVNYTVTGFANNVLASAESMEPEHSTFSEPNESVWFKWEAPSSGTVEFNTQRSDFDTVIAVYEGDDFESLTLIGANDDASDGNLWSKVVFEAKGGTEYKIAIDGKRSEKGDITLNRRFSGTEYPPNDRFEQKAWLDSTLFYKGSNINATGEISEPNHVEASLPLSSVWWEWSSPSEEGFLTISTRGSSFDTTLAVYEGDTVDSLTLVAQNDNFLGLQSQVTFQPKANTTYSIAVDGVGDAQGNIEIYKRFSKRLPMVNYDYDGDRIADLVVRRPSRGQQYIKLSSDSSIKRYSFGLLPEDVPVSGDFDDDGISDLAIYRTTDGSFYILRSSDGQVERKLVYISRRYFEDDIPVPADYDGDGVTDVAIFSPACGAPCWLILNASGGRVYTRNIYDIGAGENFIPVPGDFDGDGLADYVVYEANTNQWTLRKSRDEATQRVIFGEEFEDIAVPGDYDGDGITDFAIRRPSTGMWYIRYSSSNQIVRGYFGSQSTDVPVQADYDGDGRTDIAIRRPSTGQIMYARSGSNNAISRFYFGSEPTDIPIAAPAIYRLHAAGNLSGLVADETVSSLLNDESEQGDYVYFEILDALEAQRIFHQEITEEESMH